MRKSLILSAAALMLAVTPAFAGTETKAQSPEAPAPVVNQATDSAVAPAASQEVKKEGEIKATAHAVATEIKPEIYGEGGKVKSQTGTVVPHSKDLPAKH